MERNSNQNLSKSIGLLSIGLVLGIIAGLIFYRFVLDEPQQSSFYAYIEEVSSETHMLVDGLHRNDIRFRDLMTVHIDDNTDIIINSEQVELNEFKTGDFIRISVPSDTLIQEIYPATIVEPAIRIELFDLEEEQDITFDAQIEEIFSESSIRVNGLDRNGVNFRGLIDVNLDSNTEIITNSTEIDFIDLEIGDIVQIDISANSTINEIYPLSIIDSVLRIERLDE